MENKKIDINTVLSGLTDTASMIQTFLNQTKEGLSEEQKDLLDKEFKKAQNDLSKVMTNIGNFKI